METVQNRFMGLLKYVCVDLKQFAFKICSLEVKKILNYHNQQVIQRSMSQSNICKHFVINSRLIFIIILS